MSSLSKSLPAMIEKPDDLTLEECQEAFAMFRTQRKVHQCIELIMKSQGLWHIRDQIFGPLNHETLENCRKVSESWNESLQRMALVKYLEEFGERKVVNGEETKVSTIVPEWNKAVKDYGAKSSIEALQEIKDSLYMINGKHLEYPIHQAAGHGALKLMEFILTTSFDMNSIDQHGKNIFQVACQNGKIEIVNLLIESTKHDIDLNARDNHGATALLLASKQGRTETVKLLIELSTKNDGIDLNARDNKGWSALKLACYFGRTGIVKSLIELSTEYAIDLHARDNKGGTSLHWACDSRIAGLKIAKLLIELSTKYGINVNARDNYGRTPFHWTCWKGKPETVKLLIESSTKYGIDVNARDNNGDTALHLACSGARTEIVENILKHWKTFGIDIKAKNNVSQTALDVVNQMRFTEIPPVQYELNKVKIMLEHEYSKIDVGLTF